MPQCEALLSNVSVSSIMCQRKSMAGTARFAQGKRMDKLTLNANLYSFIQVHYLLRTLRFTDFQVHEISKDGEVIHLHDFQTNARELAKAVSLLTKFINPPANSLFLYRERPASRQQRHRLPRHLQQTMAKLQPRMLAPSRRLPRSPSQIT